MSKTIFELSVTGANSFALPAAEVAEPELKENIPENLLRVVPLNLPDVSEVQAVRHFTALSHQAYGVDDGMYALGSCTMKYNPKISEWAANLPGFTQIHPYQAEHLVQGSLELMYKLAQKLLAIGGMERFSLQPAAGAHGELTGVMIIKAYHKSREDFKRTKMLVPDSAHGTNPATCNVMGLEVIQINSNDQGLIDIDDLRAKMNDEVAGLMLTNPNTLGLFEEHIGEIADIVHAGGGLLYYDGANLNAIMGKARPGDMGFDIVHYNLHKTFSTPHGGGGPGSGPVGVKGFLQDFLPVPLVDISDEGQYFLNYDIPHTIGKVRGFFGNFGVLLKAYTYILSLGDAGIIEACEQAVLNANYLRYHLRDAYHIPFDRVCKHELVITAQEQMEAGHVTTLDIAKRLIDYGYHPPTIYFPLIVAEAMMLEPTETEARDSLDAFIAVMHKIAEEARENPGLVQQAPHNTRVRRLDETAAARKPILRWSGGE